jgi:hypothetical protein
MLDRLVTPRPPGKLSNFSKIRTVSYTRCSTQGQEEKNSNRVQQALIDAFCERQHIEHIATYPDVGSGDSAKRDPLWRALQRAQDEGCSITVTTLDRLTRSPTLIERIYSYGVPIILTSTSRPLTKSEALKLAKKAGDELVLLREAAKSNPSRGAGDLEKGRAGSIVVRGSEAERHGDDVLERVARIFVGRDPKSWGEVARELELHGVATPTGKLGWTAWSAQRMFLNAAEFARKRST